MSIIHSFMHRPGAMMRIKVLVILIVILLCIGSMNVSGADASTAVSPVNVPVVSSPVQTSVVSSGSSVSSGDVSASDVQVEATNSASSTVTVVSGAPAFMSGWSYRKIHAIGGSPDGDLTDYQMRFVVWRTDGTDSGENVYVGTNVREDYGDLRFTTTSGSEIPYWIESVGANSAVVWVKVPAIPRAGTQVVMYYGNPGAASESDGPSVFSIFEDFEESVLSGWTLDSGVTVSQVTEGSNQVGRFTSNGVAGSGAYKSWTAGSGIIEYSIKPAQTTAYHTVSAFSGHASGVKGVWFYAANNGKFGSATPSWAYYTSYAANQWYTVRLDLKGNGYYDAYINGVKIGTDWAYYGSTTTDRLGLVGWTTGGQAYYDNIRVRKYTNTGSVHGGWLSGVTTEQLVADFSFTPTSGQYPLNVTFTDLSTGPITSRSWDFGDGSSSTEQNPSHTFTGANTYSVTLTVSSTYGQSPSSTTKTIVVSAPPSFPADWQDQKIFVVSSGTGSTITSTPFKLTLYRTDGTDSGNTVYLGSSVRSDFGDIRFTDSGGAHIPYWIESISDGVAVVWVKPASISSTGTQFSIYYNCAGATSQSDGSSVFSVFEDFEESVLSGWTLDSGVTVIQVTEGSNQVGRFTSNGVAGSGVYKSWTTGSGIIEYSIKPAQTTAYHTVSAFSGHASGIKGAWFYAANNGKFGSATPSWAYSTSYTANQWYTVRLDLKGNGYYDAYVNGVKIGTDWAYYGSTTTDRLGLVGWTTGGQAFYDNIRVRPYVSTEPIVINWVS